MYESDEAAKIIDELEILEAERCEVRERGPHFRILHRCHEPYTPCGVHEVAAVYVIHAGCAIQVGMGTILALLFDFLARHNQMAQTAKQVERGFRPERLSGRRSSSASLDGLRICIPRRYVRIYMERIRKAIAKALREAELDIEPDAVLASEDTATNETGYRLHGIFEWLHIGE